MENKTIIFLGSSVTYGVDNWSMCEYVRENTTYDVVKWAVSGTTLADIDEGSYESRLNKQIDSRDVCDCFICQLSTNDSNKNLPLGEMSESTDKNDFDTKTIIGAIEYIVAAVKEKWDCPIMFYTGTFMERESYQNMVDSLFDISKKWNFGIIDLWNDPEMRAIDEDSYKMYMNDPVHPSKLGYEKWWGPKFVEAINNVFLNK